METESKPCDLPCPQCGSTDILRRFRAKDSHMEGEKYGLQPSKYTTGPGTWVWTVTTNHITRHCRCCQYDWQTKPLPKPRKRKTATSA